MYVGNAITFVFIPRGSQKVLDIAACFVVRLALFPCGDNDVDSWGNNKLSHSVGSSTFCRFIDISAMNNMEGILSPTNNSFSEQNCSFLSSVNLYLVVVGLAGLPLNILSWIVCYSRLRTQTNRNSRDVLLAALILVDFLTICIPLPIYLIMYSNCRKPSITDDTGRPSICEIFHLMYIWLKLAALFIITTLNYTSYLAVTSRGLYRSIGDRISSSFSCSANEQQPRETRNKSIVIVNLAIGIALVAFLIASLPYLGLGPEGKHPLVKNSKTNFLCCLEQISYPEKNKEYTFLFSLLMSSSACLLLQVVHNISSCFSCSREAVNADSSTIASRSPWNNYNRRFGMERNYAKMICVLGLTYHLTWIPVMIAVGGIMSSHQISAEFSHYAVAASFLPASLEPILYAVFLLNFREGYMVVLRTIPVRISRLCKECTMLPDKSEVCVTTAATSAAEETELHV